MLLVAPMRRRATQMGQGSCSDGVRHELQVEVEVEVGVQVVDLEVVEVDLFRPIDRDVDVVLSRGSLRSFTRPHAIDGCRGGSCLGR
jgi:hypothetical protein